MVCFGINCCAVEARITYEFVLDSSAASVLVASKRLDYVFYTICLNNTHLWQPIFFLISGVFMVAVKSFALPWFSVMGETTSKQVGHVLYLRLL